MKSLPTVYTHLGSIDQSVSTTDASHYTIRESDHSPKYRSTAKTQKQNSVLLVGLSDKHVNISTSQFPRDKTRIMMNK